jgi:hypothetical protein
MILRERVVAGAAGFASTLTGLMSRCRLVTFVKVTVLNVLEAVRQEIVWLTFNLIGLLAPILFEGWLIMPRSEWDSSHGIDVTYAWTIYVFPVLVAVFVLNLTWLTVIWLRHHGTKLRTSIGVWLLASSVWLIPLCFSPVFCGLIELMIRLIDDGARHHSV